MNIRKKLRESGSFTQRRVSELPGTIMEIHADHGNGPWFSWKDPEGEIWLIITGENPLAYRRDGESLRSLRRWLRSDDFFAPGRGEECRDCVDFVFGDKVPFID